MATRKAQEIPGPLENTRRRFERWRDAGLAKSRIPEALWDAAARMAQRYGLARTASVLRLDYYRLKKRLDENGAHRSEAPRAAAKTTFIEFFIQSDTSIFLPAHFKELSLFKTILQVLAELYKI